MKTNNNNAINYDIHRLKNHNLKLLPYSSDLGGHVN